MSNNSPHPNDRRKSTDMRSFFKPTPVAVKDGTGMTSQQELDSRLEERSESFKKDAGSAKALKLSKAKVEAEAWESDPWRDNHFKGMREEMHRREASRRERQRTTEADEGAVCEVSEGNLILLRAEPNPEASRPVQKKQSSLSAAAEVNVTRNHKKWNPKTRLSVN